MGYFWSGKHGRAVKGLCLVTLVYTDANGVCLPVNFRLVDKAEAKTKNELFRERVEEVLGWGLPPGAGERRAVGTPGWKTSSSSGKRDSRFLIGLEKNRIVSERPHEYVAVETLALPQSGKVLHLREFGFVTVFRTVDKNNAVRHYAQYDPRKKSAGRSLRAFFATSIVSIGASSATIVASSNSARPSGSSCVGSRPSATTSSVPCVLSCTWRPNAQAA